MISADPPIFLVSTHTGLFLISLHSLEQSFVIIFDHICSWFYEGCCFSSLNGRLGCLANANKCGVILLFHLRNAFISIGCFLLLCCAAEKKWRRRYSTIHIHVGSDCIISTSIFPKSENDSFPFLGRKKKPYLTFRHRSRRREPSKTFAHNI